MIMVINLAQCNETKSDYVEIANIVLGLCSLALVFSSRLILFCVIEFS